MKRHRTKVTELKFLTTEFRDWINAKAKVLTAKYERYAITGIWQT